MGRQRFGLDRETARRQERKREQEMLRFPLDVRCVCLFPTCSLVALFLSRCIGESQEKKEAALVKSFYFVASDTERCCESKREKTLWMIKNFSAFLCDAETFYLQKDLNYWQSLNSFLEFDWLKCLKDFVYLFSSTGCFFFYLEAFIFSFFSLWFVSFVITKFLRPCPHLSLSLGSLSPGELNHLRPPSLSEIFQRCRFSGLSWTLLRFLNHVALRSSASEQPETLWPSGQRHLQR